jgi:uncharacterized DUF497 family protein
MFEWDKAKNEINKKLHGISFEDVTGVFSDVFALVKEDPDHPEERFVILGAAKVLLVVVVAYTYRHEAIRIISARKATKRERKVYETQRKG